MKNNLLLLYYIFYLLLLCHTNSFSGIAELTTREQEFIQEHPQIILGGGLSFEPFLIKNSDGSISGFDVDVVQLVKEKTGLNISFELGLWSEIQIKAEQGELDGLSTSGRVKERLTHYNFSSPYSNLTSMLFVKTGNPKGIYNQDDIDGKNAAVQKGNILFKQVIESLPGNKTITYYPEIYDLFRSVASGETDFTILDETAFYVTRKIGAANFIQAAFPVGEPLPLVFSIRKDWPEAVSIINKALAQFTEHEKITMRNKWFGNYSNQLDAQREKLLLSHAEKKFIADHPKIRVANEQDWPPFDFNTNGTPKGLAIDYIQLLASRVGIEIEFVHGHSWSELLSMFEQKQIDVMPVLYRTAEREKFTLYTQPFYKGKLGIFTHSDTRSWNNNLYGKKVGIEKSHGSIDIVKKKLPGIILVQTDHKIELVQKLATKELDAIIGNPFVFHYLARQNQINEIQLSDFITLNAKEQQNTSLHIGVRDDWPLLHQILQKAMTDISDEEMDTILNKWENVSIIRKINWTTLLQIFSIVMGIFIFLLWHNRQLNSRVAMKTRELQALNNTLESKVTERTKKLVKANQQLNDQIKEIKTLRGILPICSSCKKIRDDEGYWNQIESYIASHSEAEFTHSICQECAKKLYPDLTDDFGNVI